MTFKELLETLTIQQAIAWDNTSEKTLYVDYDILSPHDLRLTDARQNVIECKFEQMLEAEAK